jgi:hypothetical protein
LPETKEKLYATIIIEGYKSKAHAHGRDKIYKIRLMNQKIQDHTVKWYTDKQYNTLKELM